VKLLFVDTPKPAAAPAAAAVLIGLLLAGALLLAASARAFPRPAAAPESPAESAGLYARVVRVDRDAHELELKFIIQPKETRVIFSGDPPRVLAGDYVNFRIQNNRASVAGSAMTCSKIIWVLP